MLNKNNKKAIAIFTMSFMLGAAAIPAAIYAADSAPGVQQGTITMPQKPPLSSSALDSLVSAGTIIGFNTANASTLIESNTADTSTLKSSTTSIITPKIAGMVTVTSSSGANIRRGPGTNYSKIGAANYGAELDYAGVSQKDSYGTTWYKVHGVVDMVG
jgi:hypothetical protein